MLEKKSIMVDFDTDNRSGQLKLGLRIIVQ